MGERKPGSSRIVGVLGWLVHLALELSLSEFDVAKNSVFGLTDCKIGLVAASCPAFCKFKEFGVENTVVHLLLLKQGRMTF